MPLAQARQHHVEIAGGEFAHRLAHRDHRPRDAALALAQQYGIASSEAAKLIGLQAELARRANAKAALADQRAGERSPGSSGAAEAAAAEAEDDAAATDLDRLLGGDEDGESAPPADAAGAPRLAGTVTDRLSVGVAVLLEEPAPGTAMLLAEAHGPVLGVSTWCYLYGDDAARLATEVGERWSTWLQSQAAGAEPTVEP